MSWSCGCSAGVWCVRAAAWVRRCVFRNLVLRIRRYSVFAADVAAGGLPPALRPSGRDELGGTLDEMVRLHQHDGDRTQAQAQFVDIMQATE